MDKISAHGYEVGRVDLLTSRKAYFSDRTILENQGFGWKVRGKVKDGWTPTQAFENQKARTAQVEKENPCYSAYKKELHNLTGIDKRWKLHTAVQLMPDDPDGVWSEVCDGYGDNVHADLDELVHLCRLYQAWEIEAAEKKARTAQAATQSG